ncbi:MAG: hypothetical protein JJU02_09430, partial [Cryomorphaceae bacterium]|nr:hypothetical protein [Cryomorphaceae bacterium]
LSALLIFCFFTGKAQVKESDLIFSGAQILEKIMDLAEDDNYQKALKFTEIVPTGDTLHDVLMAERCLHYYRDSNYIACHELATELLKSPRENTVHLNVLNVLSLQLLEKYDEALVAINGALEKFPYSGTLYFRRGIVYKLKEDYKNALEDFKRAVYYNPLMSDGHVQLGVLMAQQDKWVESSLALTMALALYPEANNALSILQLIENVVTGEIEAEIDPIKTDDDDDFSDVELILHNKVAFDKKYKLKSKVEFKLLRQLQVMIETFGKLDLTDAGFFGKYYVPLFRDIYKEDHTEMFFYYLMASVPNDKLVKVRKKNAKKMEKFVAWAGPELLELNNRRYPWGKSEPQLYFAYHSGSKGVQMFGEVEDGNMIGEWKFFFDNGQMSSTGNFDNEGNRTGEWYFYHRDGLLREIERYKKGELHDTNFVFYKNGVIEREVVYNEGDPTEALNYYNSGILLNHMQLKDGKRHGPYFHYHVNGKFQAKSNFKDGELDGESLNYFDDGRVETVKQYKEGKLDGPYIDFFRDSILYMKGQYIDGEETGEWEYYHENGKLARKGAFEKGKRTGLWVEYSKGGKKSVEAIYEEGKLNGLVTNYDLQERVVYVETYEKGKLTAYTQFDADGNEVKSVSARKGNIDVEIKNVYGITTVKGKIVSGDRDGKWEYFDDHGVKTRETYYRKDELNGLATHFYPDGKISAKTPFSDGSENGLTRGYHRNGALRTIGHFRDGRRVDLWYDFYSSGVPDGRVFYRNGSFYGDYHTFSIVPDVTLEKLNYPDGNFEQFIRFDTLGNPTDTFNIVRGESDFGLKDANGTVRYKGAYKYGTRHGLITFYNGLGVKTSEGNYRLAYKDGTWKHYFRDGKLSQVEQYKNGKLHGKHISYFGNGKKDEEGEYVHGDRHGKWTVFYENGNKSVEYNYEYGVLNGASYYYSPEGELAMVRYFEKGEFMFYSYNDKNKKLVSPIPIGKDEMVLKAYFANGKPSYIAEMKYGAFHGKFERFYASGKVYTEVTFEIGTTNGTRNFYHPNGNLWKTYNDVYGETEGAYKRFFSNGKIEEERTYKTDKIHGPVYRYNTAGKRVEALMYFNGTVEGAIK